eukprot:363145-Chlamydomonas_euryale.AAC.12
MLLSRACMRACMTECGRAGVQTFRMTMRANMMLKAGANSQPAGHTAPRHENPCHRCRRFLAVRDAVTQCLITTRARSRGRAAGASPAAAAAGAAGLS